MNALTPPSPDTHRIMERDRKGPFSHTHTHTRGRALTLLHTSSVEALTSAKPLTKCGWKWVGHSCLSKRVFLSSTVNSELITMGAVWTARLLCLFLLLLNTRQSAALPHNTGKSLHFVSTRDAVHAQLVYLHLFLYFYLRSKTHILEYVLIFFLTFLFFSFSA